MLILQRERGKREAEKNDLLFHLLMHSFAGSCMCPDWGLNPQPWWIRMTFISMELPGLGWNTLFFIVFFFLLPFSLLIGTVFKKNYMKDRLLGKVTLLLDIMRRKIHLKLRFDMKLILLISWNYDGINLQILTCNLLFIDKYIYLFSERGEGREKEKERNIDVQEIHLSVAFHTPPAGVLALNPGMCPDWELNLWPFTSQASTQSTEPYQPGQ